MRRLIPITLLACALGACDRDIAAPSAAGDVALSETAAPTAQGGGGAWVFNRGEGQPGPSGANCHFGHFRTNQIHVAHTPAGNVIAKCHFEGLPPIPEAQTLSGWWCNWWINGVRHYTRDSKWTRSPGGRGMVTCRFKTQFPPPPKP